MAHPPFLANEVRRIQSQVFKRVGWRFSLSQRERAGVREKRPSNRCCRPCRKVSCDRASVRQEIWLDLDGGRGQVARAW